ncbi:MAG: hypothetical protein M5U13_13415 [Thermoanaerobaculia bacterium]|nr:hypothetical protein [Thermoanaerobaculia bacterium]
MSRAALSLHVFGLYLALVGATLAVAPNALLALFRLPLTDDVWIRVLGVVALALALYYLLSARHEVVPFFRWTVAGRCGGFVGFTALALLGFGPPALALFGAVDLAGALWTVWALRADRAG